MSLYVPPFLEDIYFSPDAEPSAGFRIFEGAFWALYIPFEADLLAKMFTIELGSFPDFAAY